MDEGQAVAIPEQYAEAPWAEGGFADNNAVFDKLNEIHTAATTPKPIEIPETYKEKGWAGKEFKSAEDLFKEIDELHSLKGKKSVPFDFSTATENEINDYIKARAPEDDYDYGDVTGEDGTVTSAFQDDEKEWLGKALKETGVDSFRGKKLIAQLAARKEAVNKEHFSSEGQAKILEESFCAEGDWKKISGEVANSLKSNMSEADQALANKMPNEFLGLMYRLQHKTIKAYGIKDGEDHGGGDGGGGGSVESVEAKRTELRTKMDAIRGKMGTDGMLKKLNDELVATYKNDPRIGGK